MDNDILILVPQMDWNTIQEKKYIQNIHLIYKKVNLFLRIIRRFWFKFDLPYKSVWYGEWKYKVESFKKIIIYDSVFGFEIFDFIKQLNPNCRLIFWYYNIVNTKTSPENIDRYICELWSFDRDDCARYDLKYNIQYFYNLTNITSKKEKWDVIFVGRDKGRAKYIRDLKILFDKMELKSHIVILPGNKTTLNKIFRRHEIIPYESLIKLNEQSKAILDITQVGQQGYTKRVLEALFLKKKLISNNLSLRNEAFYKKSNIFLLGYDDLSTLKDFIDGEYVNIENEILEQFTYERWLKNFDI